jgi:hypothetical protein
MSCAEVLRLIVGEHERALASTPSRIRPTGLDDRVTNFVQLLERNDITPELGTEPERPTDVPRTTDEELKGQGQDWHRQNLL